MIQQDNTYQPQTQPQVDNTFQAPIGHVYNVQTPLDINTDSPIDEEGPVFSLKDTNTRLNFVRKVYTILACQLAFTAALCSVSVFYAGYLTFIRLNVWLVIPSSIIMLIIFYTLLYSKTCARTVPTNYILLSVFTVCFAFISSFSTAVANPVNVFIALVLTAAVTVGLTIYAITTKNDITMCGGFLFMLGVVMIFASILAFVFQSEIFMIIITAFSVLLMGLYIVYDTQIIVGGRNCELEVDDYVLGAMILYLDIMQLFLAILKLLEHA